MGKDMFTVAGGFGEVFMINASARSIVEKFITRLKRAGIPVQEVYVFGSQVKGTAHPYSDIDTCVVSAIFGHNRHNERLQLMELLDDQTGRIEPHPYSRADLSNKFDPLANEIRKTGVRVI